MTRPGLLTPTAVVVALLAATAAPPARADVIVSPPGANVLGNGQGVAPFTNKGDTDGNRYQQVYSSSFFSGVGSNLLITDVAFRLKQPSLGGAITANLSLSNVVIRLSTTSRNADTDFPNGLSGDLALNPGADARTVYSGPLTLTSSRPSGVNNFDFLIPFQTPFSYQPGRGNLLLDVTIPAGASVTTTGSIGFTQLDSFTDGFPSRDGTASATDANLLDGLTVGSNSTTGAVTRFTVQALPTPEPTTLVVFSVGLGVTSLVVRRRRRTV